MIRSTLRDAMIKGTGLPLRAAVACKVAVH
jgi:hypothetical protein